MRKIVFTTMTALLCSSASAETLLSANKPVTAGLTDFTGELSDLVDGDFSDATPLIFDNQANPDQSVTIDLGANNHVTRLGIHTGNGLSNQAVRDFRVWYSTDGETFKNVLGATRRNGTYADVDHSIDLAQPIEARYIRFVSLERWGASKIREIEVYGSAEKPDRDFTHFFPSSDGVSPDRITELNEQVIDRFEANLPRSHPRLHGDQAQYWSYMQPFETASADTFKGDDYSYATVKNIYAVYNRGTYAMKYDENDDENNVAYPTTLRSIPEARFYLDVDLGQIDKDLPKGASDRAMRMLHLIRMVDACMAFDPQCRFQDTSVPGELSELKRKFIQFEYRDFQRSLSPDKARYDCPAIDGKSVPRPYTFHHGGNGCYFDLGAIRMFRPWTAIMDYFWDEDQYWATEGDKAEVLDFMTSYAKMYLTQSDPNEKLHWTVSNPNNWNVILGESALRFATLVYDEPGYEDMARDLLENVLKYSWNHRRIYMDQGMYQEGTGYMATDYASTGPTNNFYMRTVGEPMHAMKWGVADETARWFTNAMAPDGHALNFGDAWKVQGFRNAIPLDLILWQEMVGLAPAGSVDLTEPLAPDTPNPKSCIAARFFANHYYDNGMSIPMLMGAHLARDWAGVVEACGTALLNSTYSADFPFNESVFRVNTDRITYAASGKTPSPHVRQSNQTSMAMSCVPNNFPHRELDCFDMKWSVHGSRFIDDTGYGDFNKGYEYYQIGGSKGHVPFTSTSDMMEFYTKPLNNVNMKKAFIAINVAGKEHRLPIGNFMENVTPDADGWYHVKMPLTAFTSIKEKQWETSVPSVNGGKGVGAVTFTIGSGMHLSREGSFAIDEISFSQGSGSRTLWYGDARTDSVEGDSVQFNKARFHVVEETGGGANGTDGWLRIGSDIKATGRIVMYYHDVPDDRVVKNYYDGFAVGANSLIVPDAQYSDPWFPRPQQTHMGQIAGASATGKTFKLNGLQGVSFDASKVYGNGDKNGDGWLNKAIRYKIALPNGNYLVVDDFQTKPKTDGSGDLRESLIQEFWYTPYDDVETCALPKFGGMSHHVDVTFSGVNTVDFEPRCMILFFGGNVTPEAQGRMTAASLAGDVELKFGPPSFMADDPYFRRFIKDDTITQINRKRGTDVRRLLRFEPPAPVSQDVRAFLFQGGLNHPASDNLLKPQSLRVFKDESCPTDSFCIEATIGDEAVMLNFDKIKSDDQS